MLSAVSNYEQYVLGFDGSECLVVATRPPPMPIMEIAASSIDPSSGALTWKGYQHNSEVQLWHG
jgi:hypothetical protein